MQQGDFLDIVYSYSINSTELRGQFRTAMLGYLFDIKEEKEEDTDKTFSGFTKSAGSMLDELDAFRDQMADGLG